MRVFISIILAGLVWFISTQAMASVDAQCAAASFFTCKAGSISFTAIDSTTTQGELWKVEWDWDDDGTYDETTYWNQGGYANQHQWATGGVKYVTVKVWNNANPPEWDTVTSLGPFYVADPTIIAEPDEGWREVDVDFSVTDSLPGWIDRDYAWFFDWDGMGLPDWGDADSYADAPTHHYVGPDTFLCLVLVKYGNNEDWICNDTQVIVVH